MFCFGWMSLPKSTKSTGPNSNNKGSVLLQLPFDLRLEIYRCLLTVGEPIERAGDLVQAKIHFRRETVEYLDLGVAILSTCRQVYEEALPILYGENEFVFRDPKGVEAFRTEGLDKKAGPGAYNIAPNFRFLPNADGRLTLVKIVHLIFSPVNNSLGRPESDSDRIIEAWQPFFNPRLYGEEHYDREKNVKFPALRSLLLDFEQLELEEEAIATAPINKKFSTPEGLEMVSIKGVRHTGMLKRLESGLLKPGGKFIVTTNRA